MTDHGDIDWRSGPPLPAQRPRTLAELVAACVDQHGDRPVLFCENESWSWRQLDRAANALAHHWSDVVEPGDRIGIQFANSAEHLVAEMAAWRLAAIAAPIDPRLRGRERDNYLQTLSPAVVVGDPPPIGPWLVLPRSGVRAAMALDHPVQPWRLVQQDAPALALATSGSTGTPRQVILTNDNICSQQAAFALLWPQVGDEDRFAAYLPWHHSFGALAERLWALVRGAQVHVLSYDHHQPEVFADQVQAIKPTVYCSVPALHRVVQAHAALDLNVVKFVFTAGAHLADSERAWYAQHGIAVHEGWGCTETSPACTIAAPVREHGVVGQPIPGVEVGVRASDQHILVRGPNVMAGYWGDAAATAAVIQNGIFDSGDCGCWTDHGLQLSGRSDTSIKLANGERLPVAWLEVQLNAYAGIVQAVVTVLEDAVVAVCETSLTDGELDQLVADVNARCARPWQRISRVVCCRDHDAQRWTATGKPVRSEWHRAAVRMLQAQPHCQ